MCPVSSITVAGPRSSAAGCRGNCEVIIGSYSFGQNSHIICSKLNVKVFILEGEDRLVSALLLLELAILVTVKC